MPSIRNYEGLQESDDCRDVSVLFDRFYMKIFRYLYYKLGDPHIAEDLASEVFMRLVRNINRNSELRITPAWLFTIAHNLAVDHFRSLSTQLAAPLEESTPMYTESVESTIDQNLDSQALQTAIKTLSEDQAEVILLRFINNLSIADTASTMGRSETAIKALQRRALLSLRKFFSEREVSYV